MNLAAYRRLVSGSWRGASGALLRGALWLGSLPYALAVVLRNGRFEHLRNAVQAVDVPVVSVGNLTTGGTGKTPLVEWIARYYRDRQLRVALVSRGYGAERAARNDEALELEQRLGDVPHLQDPDRVAAARIAVEELESQLIVLDDGFQHRRIHRDLDIVLLDALEPFGYGHLLPRGLLREPVGSLRRADAVLLTRCDGVSDRRRAEIRSRVARLAPAAVWGEVAFKPLGFRSASGEVESLAELAGQEVLAFCGIGNPAGFQHTLQACGVQVLDFREFPDHHAYGREDIDQLDRWVASHPCQAVLCTHKDLVKLQVATLGARPLRAVAIGVEFCCGEAEFQGLLGRVIAGDGGCR